MEVARIAAVEGDGILVSGVVRRFTKGKDFLFADQAVLELPGFESPVCIFGVSWRD